MNKDKAIQLLERLQDPEPYEPMLTKDAYDAIQMAIDALSADGDTISREAAVEAINKALDRQTLLNCFVRKVAIDTIKQLPPAQPRREERKIGEWIYDWGDWDFETCKCSECGNHTTTPIGERYSFCPNCGAKMEVTT